MSTRSGAALIVIGGALIALSMMRPTSEPQAAPATSPPPATAPARRSPSVSTTITTSTTSTTSTTMAAMTVPTTSVSPSTTMSVGVPPASVTFPATGATAPVRPVGVLSSGELQLPDNPTVVGWWAGGAAVGSDAGSIVIAGHVDSRRYGVGTFATLHQLMPGDIVDLSDELGRVQHFAVTERRQSPKTALDAELFATDGPVRLVLLTCGGEFDEDHRSYADNVIVIATPTA